MSRKDCAIMFTTQKNEISGDELMSLKSIISVFGNRRDIYLVTKNSTKEDFYRNLFPEMKFVHMPDEFMSSYQNYNRMCMSNELYRPFSEYKYLLTTQPDVYAFRDNLDYFMDMGYDYYGAPLVNCPSWGVTGEIVGCGGLSLRRIEKFLEITKPYTETSHIPEDLYFSTHKELGINKCPVDTALELCFSADTKDVYDYWYKRTNGKLPSFCHIFRKNDTWRFWGKIIEKEEGISQDFGIHMVSFNNTSSNFSSERFIYECNNTGRFQSVNVYSEKDFDTEYWEKNKEHFNNTRGYGYWSWKPYFILQKMSEIREGDVIIYSDVGSSILKKNCDTLDEWISLARNSECGILSPCFGPYKEINWTKYDTFDYINRTYNKEGIDIFHNATQCGAGILVIIKNRKSEEFIRIWNDIMENHFELIIDSPSVLPNVPQFREHRHDQSVFSMLSKIFKIATINTNDGILNKNKSPIICTRCKNDKSTWKRPLRILYDSQIFDLQRFGGISKVFTEIIKETDKNEIIENFTGNGCAKGKYNEVESTIGVLNTNNENLLANGFKNTGINKTNRQYCIELLKKGDFDVFVPTFYDTYFLEYLNGKPFVLFIPDMITELYPQYFSANDLQNTGKKTLAPKASHIMVPTENTKNDIIKILDIPPERISVISHAISESYGVITSDRSVIDTPYILYVGQRNAYKRFDLFLKYSKPFLDRHQDYIILFTGPKFNNNEMEYIRHIGLSGRLAHINITNDIQMASLYRHARCFVYSSEYEGFGIPILESYRMRCPVLLNNRSCFPEVAGDAAIYFNMNENESDLTEKLEYAVSMNESEKSDLLRRQDDRLRTYSWKKTSEIVKRIFKETRT